MYYREKGITNFISVMDIINLPMGEKFTAVLLPFYPYMYIYIILEELKEQLDIHKQAGMTDEQVKTANDIRKKGKNTVGVNFFKISAMNNIFFFFLLFILYLSYLKNTAQNSRKRANDRFTGLTEGNITKTIIQSIHFH